MAKFGEDHVWGFDEDVARALKAKSGMEPPEVGQAGLGGKAGGFIVKIPSGGIAKRVGDTVTVVDCDAYFLDGTGSTRTLTSLGFTVPVGNMSSTNDVAADNYVLPTWHGGCLIANWEDCEG